MPNDVLRYLAELLNQTPEGYAQGLTLNQPKPEVPFASGPNPVIQGIVDSVLGRGQTFNAPWRFMRGGQDFVSQSWPDQNPRRFIDKSDPEFVESIFAEPSQLPSIDSNGLSGVIKPTMFNLPRKSSLLNVWGKTPPRSFDFEVVDRLPELRQAIVKGEGINNILYGTKLEPGVAQIAEKYGKNPYHKELAAAFRAGRVDLDTAESLFRATANKADDGKSVFDKTFDLEINRRGEAFQPGYNPYKENKGINVSRLKEDNRKVGQELLDADTSMGCIGNCPECYAAYGGATQSKKCFMSPQPVRLTGHFRDNPEMIRRIGTSGEPNMNPIRWKQLEPEFKQMVKEGRMTPDELDRFIADSYDWAYTNDQLRRTGLDTPGHFEGSRYVPGGRDQTFIITKLQSLDGFDPAVTHNLEVSLDPMMPSHFFKALRNVDRVKKAYPDVNVMLRIRSVATQSDEINSLQQMAVDYANKNSLPVLETRVRFKKSDTAALAQILPEYFWEGGQYKHVSYYPTEKPKLDTGTALDGFNIRAFEVHGESGPLPTQVYLRSPLGATKGMSKSKKAEAPIWEVWDGGKMVGSNMSIEDATEMGQEIAKKTNPDKTPSKIKVREYALEESPLSQFGLNPQLHKQCNTFNMGAGACGECQACRAWLNEEKARSILSSMPRKVESSGKP